MAVDNGEMMSRIRYQYMATVWTSDKNVVRRVQYCPMTNTWIWSKVAKCSCGSQGQYPHRQAGGEEAISADDGNNYTMDV